MSKPRNSSAPKHPRNALVVVSSTRAAAGTYEDRSGPLGVQWLRDQGFDTPDPVVLADAEVPEYLGSLFAKPEKMPRIILTSGGTGLTTDDKTVEAVRPHLEKELPGIMMEFFRRGTEKLPSAVLSGGVAGTVGGTFIMTLPGSTGAMKDGIAVLEPLIDHIVAMLEGFSDHE